MDATRRAATESDRPFVAAAMRAAYEELVVRVAGQWDEASNAAGFAEKWAAGGFEVVERDGRPIGATWTSDEGEFLRLREIFLLPGAQGQGIGTALIEAEVRNARRAGKPLRLRVLRENRARALYARLGFVECGDEGGKVWMEAT